MAHLVIKQLVSLVHTYPDTFDTSTQTIKENDIAQPFNYKKKYRYILTFLLVALLFGIKKNGCFFKKFQLFQGEPEKMDIFQYNETIIAQKYA